MTKSRVLRQSEDSAVRLYAGPINEAQMRPRQSILDDATKSLPPAYYHF